VFRRFLLPIAILLALVGPLACSADQPRYLELTILTTNDLHANLVPFDHPDNLKGKAPVLKGVGGAARRATIVNRVRAESTCPVLLLDSGDTTYGNSKLAKAFHGAPDIAVLNAMNYDAMAPGNHEFQWPSVDTLRNIRDSRFPWVCANLCDEKTGKLFFEPYVIRDIEGVRVAFLGLISQLVNSPPYKARIELGLTATEPIEAAKKIVPEIRQKADIVICLSHLGVSIDQTLARTVPGIDIILGGHSHTRLARPILVPSSTPTASCLGAVPIVQAFLWGSEMGETQVIFHRDELTGAYSLMSCKGDLISLDKSVPDDSAIAALINSYQQRLGAQSAPAAAATPATSVGR